MSHYDCCHGVSCAERCPICDWPPTAEEAAMPWVQEALIQLGMTPREIRDYARIPEVHEAFAQLALCSHSPNCAVCGRCGFCGVPICDGRPWMDGERTGLVHASCFRDAGGPLAIMPMVSEQP